REPPGAPARPPAAAAAGVPAAAAPPGPASGGPAGLNCAGFGSSVCVTASFGFAAAAHALKAIAARG
ncbi:hypothetical protein MMZ06_25345, partial [Burkholderia gladioli]|nr:hypothetical protein [Burkholderia gladioli]